MDNVQKHNSCNINCTETGIIQQFSRAVELHLLTPADCSTACCDQSTELCGAVSPLSAVLFAVVSVATLETTAVHSPFMIPVHPGQSAVLVGRA
jgi:hypothetical protein